MISREVRLSRRGKLFCVWDIFRTEASESMDFIIFATCKNKGRMRKTIIFAALTAVLAMGVFASCSENSDSNVVVPQFRGIEFNKDLVAGTEVVATAVQSKTGKYIDRTNYSWSFEDAQSLGGGVSGVFYGSDKRDPTCTILLPETPGRYTVTFNATYNVSGKAGNSTKEVEISGGKITYTTSPFTCTVRISQEVRVVAQ